MKNQRILQSSLQKVEGYAALKRDTLALSCDVDEGLKGS